MHLLRLCLLAKAASLHIPPSGKLTRWMSEDLRGKFRVLYDDEHLIILNKPANVLSVPGREFRVKALSRVEQWATAIDRLSIDEIDCGLGDSDKPIVAATIERLQRQPQSVPRQKGRFYAQIRKLMKVEEAAWQDTLWNKLTEIDKVINGFDLSTLPNHLLSAADYADEVSKVSVRHVHRLDQETSGVIIFAKSTDAARVLGFQFSDRQTKKTYIALVHGIVAEPKMLIEAPIAEIEEEKPKKRVDVENGKPSSSILEVLDPSSDSYASRRALFGEVPEDIPTTLVKLQPLTGRSHQLRVHMMHIGHPIVGDSLYSPHLDLLKITGRMLLHAESIKFKHPVTNEEMTITAGPLDYYPNHCQKL